MKKQFITSLFFLFTLVFSSSAFAELITGTIIAGGEESTISFETDVLKTQNVIIDDMEFEITMIDDNFLLAGTESLEIGIIFGKSLSSLIKCSKETIVERYKIENISELNCSEGSKGFLYLKTPEFTIGNCIN